MKSCIRLIIELGMMPTYLMAAMIARFYRKQIDVGLGPEPLINNIYHKKALEKYGYSAETFVFDLFFITNRFDRRLLPANKVLRRLCFLLNPFFFVAVFRYRAIYIYFNGGLFYNSIFLWRLEPLLYRLAKVKVVVMPYGSDVQALTRCPNLLFKHAMTVDYPNHRQRESLIKQKIDLWVRHADHVIAGCDWVDYLYGWDSLMLAHFSIDTDYVRPKAGLQIPPCERPLRILHAPNHKTIKGTEFFIKAVRELQQDGVSVELVMLEHLPNDKILEAINDADLIADQLVVGWYAMFALEAMASGKPVLCYLREDLHSLYVDAGIINEGEVPIINCSPHTIKETIRRLVASREELLEIGIRSRHFVEKHHSLGAVGAIFDRINHSFQLFPSS